ncbi:MULTISPECIES: alpha/beta hydrolase [unclassified Sporosarcina]|uniref:alpha/beta hydrolase n=1 Tax=unclassified Sporosarcina TaxID=2647733 RepID=UPI000C168985|nr:MULTISPECIES: dienelactone hydrolase family protein [unclassified Sporosarcina]PID01756.1 esterase [Sporosarcina sp. P2]PID25492.1 esterase [Sporosarcina sp. P7]
MKSPFTFTHTKPVKSEEKQPALFLLHGMGSHEDDLPQLVQEFKETHHIFSLRGPVVHAPGYAFFTIEEEGKPVREVFDKVLVYIQSFIREAIQEYDLDPERLTVIGFSQGAALAQALGVTLIPSLHGVAALSGYVPDFVKSEYAIQSVENQHVFISHGDYDYIIPSQSGVESKEYFESLGADVTFKTYNDGHGVTSENQQDLVTFIRSL